MLEFRGKLRSSHAQRHASGRVTRIPRSISDSRITRSRAEMFHYKFNDVIVGVKCIVFMITAFNTPYGFCQNIEHRSKEGTQYYRVNSQLTWNDLHDFESPKEQLIWDTILSNERKHSATVQKFPSTLFLDKAPINSLVNHINDYSKIPDLNVDSTPRTFNKRRKNDYRNHKKYKHLRNRKYIGQARINGENRTINRSDGRPNKSYGKSRSRERNQSQKFKSRDEETSLSAIFPEDSSQSFNNSRINRSRWDFSKFLNQKKLERNMEKELTRNLEKEIIKMRRERPFALIKELSLKKNEISNIGTSNENGEIINSHRENIFSSGQLERPGGTDINGGNIDGINLKDNSGQDTENSLPANDSGENEKLLEGSDNLESLSDLSCINGSFIPAPHIPHGVIKYVKSSKPEHEYLEADYECTNGFIMSSNNTRLFCKNQQWLGERPLCTKKSDESCLHLKCEHICVADNGLAKCSCHKGFILQDNKCIDVDVCRQESREASGRLKPISSA